MDHNTLDEWGSGSRGLKYSIKVGYISLLQDLTNPPCSHIWKYIWRGDSLPKINTFSFILVHESFLIEEYLQR
jgi:hypothetical protein